MQPLGRHQKTPKPKATRLWPLMSVSTAVILVLFLGLALFWLDTPLYQLDAHAHAEQLLLIITSAVALGVFITLLIFTVRLRKSEHRAAEAEHYLTAAIGNMSEGFVIYDKNERLVVCNDRYLQMYPEIADKLVPGADFEDLTELMIERRMVPGTMEEMRQWQKNRLAKFRDDHDECLNHFSDGRWVLLRDRKLPDGGSVGIRTDITNIKKHEEQLLESEHRQRDLVERAPVAIYVHHNEIIVYANAMTAQILGYDSPNLLLGKNIFDLIHSDHHRLAQTRMKKLQDGAESLPQVDMKFKRADDTAIYTEAQVSKIQFDGEPALETILRDITGRRRTEQALMESEMRYRTLFELAPDAMLVHDGHKILFANAAAAKTLGASDERKLFGLNLAKLLPNPTNEDELRDLSSWKDADNGPLSIKEARLLRLNQTPFDAEIVTAPTNYHGNLVYHAVIRDVTERKLMDATSAQNAKLASLGAMAAGLAHELSQPLNIMRFAAEGGLLKMNRGKADDALHEKNYKLLQDQAERMSAIMDSMRIFSHKDPGPMTAFDMTLSVRNTAHLLRNQFRVDGVKINILAPVSGVKVLGSPIQLEQVLLNLLKNACDSILEHRESLPDKRAGLIEVECRPRLERGDAIISISDNGGGIAPENLRQIFDPFFTTKDVGKGTGLGLALSHEIICSMSGTISAETTPDGARFTIALPISDEGTANDTYSPNVDITSQHTPPAPTPIPGRAQHVLVVEDEIEAARAMADYLIEEGFRVTIAHDGREGLEAYRRHAPDIVITDIRMPDFSGTELIQALRHLNATIPIIAVTGHMGETENIAPNLGHAPIDVMKKPVSLAELSRKIISICAA